MDFQPRRIRKRPLHLSHKLKKLRKVAAEKIEQRKQKRNSYKQYSEQQPQTESRDRWDETFKEKFSDNQVKLVKAIVIGLIIILLPVIGWASFQGIKDASNDIAIQVLSSVGKSLPTDEEGYTNFLLLGTGDPTHDGKDLTDTIIIASLHNKNHNAVLTSIPRDLFLKTEAVTYGQKINSLYATVLASSEDTEIAYEAIEEAAELISGKEIHRRVRVTFSTFEKVVDAMGGITINVPQRIYDTTFPDNNYGYETFEIQAGLQTIDGATALKYARSRHTTSDFDRSKRQQELLYAIKETAKNNGILKSPSKIQKIYTSLNEGIDTNLEIREIIELAGIAAKFDRSKMVKVPLHDDPVKKGGLLYTPPRFLYNDAFVLRPSGDDFDTIHLYLSLHYLYPEAMNSNQTLQVLNGTRSTGLATSTKSNLQRFGFNTSRFGNAPNKDYTTTTLYQKTPANGDAIARALKELVPFELNSTLPAEYLTEPYLSDSDYVLEIGTDFIEPFDELRAMQYVPPQPVAPAETEADEEEETESPETTETEITEPTPETEPAAS